MWPIDSTSVSRLRNTWSLKDLQSYPLPIIMNSRMWSFTYRLNSRFLGVGLARVLQDTLHRRLLYAVRHTLRARSRADLCAFNNKKNPSKFVFVIYPNQAALIVSSSTRNKNSAKIVFRMAQQFGFSTHIGQRWLNEIEHTKAIPAASMHSMGSIFARSQWHLCKIDPFAWYHVRVQVQVFRARIARKRTT